MTNEKPFPRRNVLLLLSIFISLFSTATLALSLFATAHGLIAVQGEPLTRETFIFFCASFFCFGVFQGILFFRERGRPMKIFRIVFSVSALTVGVLFIVFFRNDWILRISTATLCVLFIAQRFIYAFTRKRVRSYVTSGLWIFILLWLALSSILSETADGPAVICGVALAAISLFTVLKEAFSKIHFATLGEIARKTYAIEILLGMLFLIISFSFAMSILEGFSYLDALWYCFAVVTTIGFGDIVPQSIFIRTLSVILGIYGIIVVAVITSIIVNFYNESRYVGKRDEEKETPKEEPSDPTEK